MCVREGGVESGGGWGVMSGCEWQNSKNGKPGERITVTSPQWKVRRNVGNRFGCRGKEPGVFNSVQTVLRGPTQ